MKFNQQKHKYIQCSALETERLLSSTPVLALYNLNTKTIVSADASRDRLGAVLLQEQMIGDLKPVSYISRLPSTTKEQYAQIE